MSDNDTSGTSLAFDCPDCGETTGIVDADSPEDLDGQIYECDGCGAHVALRSIDTDN